MTIRTLFFALIALLLATPALATEQINSFDVAIKVERDGDIIVTETINVRSEGSEIRRGIFRDLPRFYEQDGARYHYEYDVLTVQRDDRQEKYDTDSEDNAYRILIGDEDVFLENGDHTYVIRYRVKNQVRYFADHDEFYWNVTGNYWNFPIAHASAVITLPQGANITETNIYTGAIGAAGQDATLTRTGEHLTFNTTRALASGEGLTVSISIAKGLIDPPSQTDLAALWWQRNGALAILLTSIAGLFWYLYSAFVRVGRDPPKNPIFPRYEAPAGYSPAAVHYIYNRAVTGHRALIATLMQLAVKGHLTVDATDKKKTILTRNPSAPAGADLAPEDRAFEADLFVGSNQRTLGGQYDSGFTNAYTTFTTALGKKYGDDYFRWNIGYIIAALALSIGAFVIAATQINEWSWAMTIGLVALTGLNVVFMYLLPAPTVKGQQIRTEIEGLRLYMETAEKLQLNAAKPGTEAPPPMTKERYEKFLPYAVALDVEKPWTEHFEKLLPQEAANYHPTWAGISTGQSFASMSDSMVSNISSGVSSSLPQSSSSSGGGGGGSSGGGGGGGGGGGW
ncbi:MAG: DUF2207 domain-containing protein [Hyphomonadaceae bacterium]|nr:DUF2207 domain-containing protein [Hyphomonadaceae bacterium]